MRLNWILSREGFGFKKAAVGNYLFLLGFCVFPIAGLASIELNEPAVPVVEHRLPTSPNERAMLELQLEVERLRLEQENRRFERLLGVATFVLSMVTTVSAIYFNRRLDLRQQAEHERPPPRRRHGPLRPFEVEDRRPTRRER